MKPRILYEEKSGWPLWMHPLVGLTFLAAVFPLVEIFRGRVGGTTGEMPIWMAALLLALGFGLPSSLYALMGQLKTRVLPWGVEVRWGFLDVIRKTIPFDEVDGVESVSYSPLGEFGGWGIRQGLGNRRAWTIRGNRAVLFHLKDGTRFYLGSDTPDRVLQWVTPVMKRSEG